MWFLNIRSQKIDQCANWLTANWFLQPVVRLPLSFPCTLRVSVCRYRSSSWRRVTGVERSCHQPTGHGLRRGVTRRVGCYQSDGAVMSHCRPRLSNVVQSAFRRTRRHAVNTTDVDATFRCDIHSAMELYLITKLHNDNCWFCHF